MSNIQVNEGTAKTVKTRTISSEEVQAIYLNVGTASDNPFTGTVLEVSKLATGTISVNTPGTITSGSIVVTAGTIGTIANIGSISTIGTMPAISMGDISGGTIDQITNGSIVVTAGTVTTTMGDLTGGTIDEITNGSIVVTNGTVKVTTPGTITSGSIAVTAATVTSGSIVVTDGTVKVTTPGTITSGSIAVTAATVTSGSVAITSGTVGGKAASGAAAVANPVQIAGTDSGGTIYSPLITTTGAVGSIQNIGTIKEAGTVTGVGTISGMNVLTTVTNLSNGTIQNSGTTTGVGTVSGVAVVTTVTNLANGTIQSSGTSTGVGVVSNLTQGSINVTSGTVGGKAASGAAAVANPVQIAGTDSGGTIYSPLVTTAGAWGSVSGMNVLTTLNNLTNGTVRVTAGTVNSGTINAGTINTGTINEGTLSLVTTVSNLTNGSIKVTAGTGIVTASTVNSGTINAATINAATINTGTIRDDGRAAVNFLTFGTTFGGTGTAAAYATLVAAPGAGTSVWVNDLSLTNPYGTIETGIGFGTIVDGGSVLVKGVYGTQTSIGIQKTYPKAVNGGLTNQPLVVYKSGLGTVYANVSYFTSA